MSTENGVIKAGSAARHVETLRLRVAYLERRIAHRREDGEDEQRNGWDLSELAALQWVIPLAEAERDYIVRLQREVIRGEIAAHRGIAS